MLMILITEPIIICFTVDGLIDPKKTPQTFRQQQLGARCRLPGDVEASRSGGKTGTGEEFLFGVVFLLRRFRGLSGGAQHLVPKRYGGPKRIAREKMEHKS